MSPFFTMSQVQCEMWLHGLLPATSYLLSVQTVAYWGQKRLKSHKVQTAFTTVTHQGNSFSVVEGSGPKNDKHTR